MAMLVSDRDMKTALQTAAQSPFEGTDPGFFNRFKTDWQASVDATNSNAQDLQVNDAQDEFIKNAKQESGLALQPWFTPNVSFFGATRLALDPAKEKQNRDQFDAWKKDNPDSKLEFPSADDIQQQAVNAAQSSQSKAAAADRRSTGWLSSAGGLAGSFAGGAVDPVNLASLPFGVAGSAGILGTALREGAINAASSAAGEAMSYDFRKQVDPTFDHWDAVKEVGEAAVGGAVLGGGFKALAGAWHLAKTGEWPSHVRDVGNVVTREAATPASPFQPTVGGDVAHRAAISKSLDDLTNGRPVDLPPEAFTQSNARPGRVYDADGNNIGVRYEVVDADSLVTSHNDDLTANPNFPSELQPRDRSRALSQDQISGIAANLQPERLGFSPQAESGAPIVGADNLVESGNGRVMALRKVYQQEGVQADNYRNFLRAQNFDVEGISKPVLVARRVTNLDDNARVNFVTAANRSTALKMGASEQALSDARFISPDMLGKLQGSDVKAAGNQAFTRDFMANLPRAEQGSLMDKDGFLSQDGERRITSALMGRAYDEPVLLGRALEDTDNNIKSIAGALADSSAPWARMRDAVSRGEIPAGMDITKDLLDAVKIVMRARDEGTNVHDLVNQAEMFSGPGELSKILARAMFSDENLKRPVGRAKLSAFLSDFADEAMKNDAGPRLFGDALQAPDILKSSLDRVGRQDLQRVAEDRLTPEAIDKMAKAPETADVAIMDARRLIADDEERQLGPIGSSEPKPEVAPITVDLGDGRGERPLQDILDEAEEEIAAAGEIESCTIGAEPAK